MQVLADHLRQAVYDKWLEQEQGHVLKYYFDVPTVLPIILGVETPRMLPGHRHIGSPAEQLLRALMSWGANSPAMWLLPPHAQEVHEILNDVTVVAKSITAKEYRARRREHILKEGLGDLLNRVRRIADDKGLTAHVKIKSVLEELKQSGWRTFCAFESARLPWRRRFEQLWDRKQLAVDSVGSQGLFDVVSSVEFETFVGALTRIRPEATSSNVQDAAALAYMRKAISQVGSDGRGISEIRFYSEASTFERLWRLDPEARRLLTYEASDRNSIDVADESCRFIVRHADYFLLRLSIPALGFGVGTRGVASTELSRAQFRELIRQIDRVQSRGVGTTGGPDITATLAEVIDALDRYGQDVVLRRVLDSSDFEEQIAELQPDVQKLLNYIKGKKAVRYISGEVERVQLELRDKLTAFTEWSAMFQLAADRTEQIRSSLPKGIIPDVLRDLGLVRWGVNLSQPKQDQLRRLLGGMVDSDQSRRARAFAQFAAQAANSVGEEDCIVVASVFWFLEAFDALVRHVDQHLAKQRSARSAAAYLGVKIMRYAATVRGPDWKSTAFNVQKQLEDFRRLSNRRPSGERPSLLLGIGYCAFHAWRLLINYERVMFESPVDYQGAALARLADLSYTVVKSAIAMLEADGRRNSLVWAFCVNHCVYVASVTGRPRGEYDRMRNALMLLQGDKSVWHFRFADTLAFDSALKCARLAQQHLGGAKIPAAVVDQLKSDLDDAETYTEGMGPAFGDGEVETHRNFVRVLGPKVMALTRGRDFDRSTGAPGHGE